MLKNVAVLRRLPVMSLGRVSAPVNGAALIS